MPFSSNGYKFFEVETAARVLCLLCPSEQIITSWLAALELVRPIATAGCQPLGIDEVN